MKTETRIPLITLSLGVLSLLLFSFGEGASFLQYDRSAIANGELWRFLTGHWVHWSFDHFLWCSITFMVLGCICERVSRKGYLATLFMASWVIPAVSWLGDSTMHMYRGLSGLASGIFVFGALMMMRNAYKTMDWPLFSLSAGAGFAYLGKILYEFLSGSALFVNNQELFLPVPLTHLSGGLVGLIMVLFCSRKGLQQSSPHSLHIAA